MSSAQFKIKCHKVRRDGKIHLASSRNELAKFVPPTAGSQASPVKFDALIAVFDIEGFTQFCDRADWHLYVNRFLRDFTDWLFKSLLDQFSKEPEPGAANVEQLLLWEYLPVFWKPTGDGGFFIWNLHRAGFDGNLSVGNIIVLCQKLLSAYTDHFLPAIRNKVTEPPARLRCGIARGDVVALQGGRDYVGSAINLAAHLQGSKTVSFAVCRRGIDPEKCFEGEHQGRYIPKTVPLRSGTERENILVDVHEFAKLSPAQKKFLEGE